MEKIYLVSLQLEMSKGKQSYAILKSFVRKVNLDFRASVLASENSSKLNYVRIMLRFVGR